MSKYEELIVADAVLRNQLDRWAEDAHHALDMAQRCCELSDQALREGDREEAIRYSEIAVKWAEKL